MHRAERRDRLCTNDVPFGRTSCKSIRYKQKGLGFPRRRGICRSLAVELVVWTNVLEPPEVQVANMQHAPIDDTWDTVARGPEPQAGTNMHRACNTYSG